MPWIEKEFDPEFRQYILDFRMDQMPGINELIEQYKDSKKITVFHSREEADNWLSCSLMNDEKNHRLSSKREMLLDQFLGKDAVSPHEQN